MSFHKKDSRQKTLAKIPSQRQLRVGEDLRHLLAEVFLQGDIYHPELEDISITVTCVTVGADLRQATVFIVPLGIREGEKISALLSVLNEIAPQIRYAIAPKITFKNVPVLRFQEDTSFSYGAKIEELLSKQRDT